MAYILKNILQTVTYGLTFWRMVKLFKVCFNFFLPMPKESHQNELEHKSLKIDPNEFSYVMY